MKRLLLRIVLTALGGAVLAVPSGNRAAAQSSAPLVSLGLPRLAPAAAVEQDQVDTSSAIQPVVYRGVAASPTPLPAMRSGTSMIPAGDSDFAVQRVSLEAPLPVRQASIVAASGSAVVTEPFVTGTMVDSCASEGGASVDPGMVAVGSPGGTTWYGSAEALFWTTKNDTVPPLLTTVTDPNNLRATSGAIGNADTVLLYAGPLDRGLQPGGRITVGRYFTTGCKTWAIEGSGFYLPEKSDNFSANSNQFPFLARPFFQLNQTVVGTGTVGPREFVQRVTEPNRTTGTFDVNAPSQLWGADVNARCCLLSGCNWGLDVLGGVRYLNLQEGLFLVENIIRGPNAFPPTNSFIRVTDRFETENDFYGGQVGLAGYWQRGRWSLNARGKVAVGYTHQTLRISGDQVRNLSDGTTDSFQGGLLALPNANIGTFSQDRFTIVPEVGVNLGFNLTDNIRIFGGYNFLYWSSVLRPGQQIDRNLDITKIPNFSTPNDRAINVNRPQPLMQESDFWAQGVSAGLEFRW